MNGLLVADKNVETRKQMASLLIKAGYDVMVTDSAVKAIDGVLKKTTQVVLLGTALNDLTSAELIPLLKHCNPNLMIILIADDAPLPMIRKARTEGIFYHALRPAEPEGEEEIRQVVKCALENLNRATYGRKMLPH
jgi:DNA-binding NtrC family response regulator